MFQTPPERIFIAYNAYQPLFEEMEKQIDRLILHQGLLSKEQIEDWSQDVRRHDASHQEWGISEFILRDGTSPLSQGIHVGSEFIHARKIRQNHLTEFHYVVLLRNVHDSRQVLNFGSQVFPLKLKYFKEAYNKATFLSFGYLVVDMSTGTEDIYRLRTRNLPNEDTLVYLPT